RIGRGPTMRVRARTVLFFSRPVAARPRGPVLAARAPPPRAPRAALRPLGISDRPRLLVLHAPRHQGPCPRRGGGGGGGARGLRRGSPGSRAREGLRQ